MEKNSMLSPINNSIKLEEAYTPRTAVGGNGRGREQESQRQMN
jgi:hypothetical protein